MVARGGKGSARGVRGDSSGRIGTRTIFSLSDLETHELAFRIAASFRGGELVLLEGELGLGKTVFARGLAAGLGIAQEDVSSPSFTLIQEYRGGRLPMFHVDLYRLHAREEIDTLGLDDILSTHAVVVVEWADKLSASYRRDALRVVLTDLGEGSRKIEVTPGPAYSSTRPGRA